MCLPGPSLVLLNLPSEKGFRSVTMDPFPNGRLVIRHPRYWCKYPYMKSCHYWVNGYCRFAKDVCTFAHHKNSMPLCRKWTRGHCGGFCRYRHYFLEKDPDRPPGWELMDRGSTSLPADPVELPADPVGSAKPADPVEKPAESSEPVDPVEPEIQQRQPIH